MEDHSKHLDKSDMNKIAKEKTDKKKTSVKTIVFRTIGIIIACAYVLLLAFGRFFAFLKDNDYYKSLDLFSGAAPVSIVRLLSIALLTISISLILRIVIGWYREKALARRARVAILDLIGNLVKYVAIIVIICLALNAIGVDTAGIFASLGIIALIIGLGVTSLIEDIVAGIFIIAERTFDVGDIIVLDGFRGTVVTVGIRSTKIADVGGDILTVRNSSIGSLVNLTDRQSSAAITIPIAPDESIEHVEEVIKNANIEKIADKNANILSAPIYIGLCDITAKGVQMLLFVAGCKEDNKYEVQRVLFHELKIIFESNNIKLGNPGVIIDEEN